MALRWRVRIPYREPTYQARRGRADPFVATYDVSAPDGEAAIELALAQFEGEATESGVGWIREPILEQVAATKI